MLFAGLCISARGIEIPKTEREVADAVHWLGTQARFEEARDVAATWLKAHPQDKDVIAQEASTMALQAGVEPNATRATDLRKRAYAEAVQARKMGSKDLMLDVIFSSIDADGRDLQNPNTFSNRPEAVAEMQKGEQAFQLHDFATALACYQKALALDPHSYSAALYIGDVYFNQNKHSDAAEWFGKAIGIDPNRETAHRYLGDVYAKLGKPKEARSAYVDAIIAEPYARIPREILARFANRTKTPLRTPQTVHPAATVAVKKGQVQINVDPAEGAFIMAYTVGRAHWLVEERAKYFAKDDSPRHSLYEECAGLRLLITTAGELAGKEDEASKKLAPGINGLKSLDKAGLLEAYVLLDAPDEGIAQDYATYRQLHRDMLLRYINEVWLGEPSGQSALNAATKTSAPIK